MTEGLAKIDRVMDRAQEAFWAEVADGFPEILSGDFPPCAQFTLDAALTQAIRTWYRGNLKLPPT